MTIRETCPYGDSRDQTIVEYLYGEIAAQERAAFTLHLTDCSTCRAEIDGLRGVRQALATWVPPQPTLAFDRAPSDVPRLVAASATTVESVDGGTSRAAGKVSHLAHLPAWARVAAAVLCVGVGLGAANIRISYSADGVSVRTGWLSQPESPASGPSALPAGDPWRSELTALAEQLRAEMQTMRSSAVTTVAAHDQPTGVGAVRDDQNGSDGNDEHDRTLRQMRQLIAKSEQRQQRELALRMGDLLNDLQTQRRADLSRIERTIGVVENTTGLEVLRQREMLNTLAVRVSSQRQ